MAVNTQFSIAVHLLAGLGLHCDEGAKSADLAGSVNTSASFVRRVLAKLSHAGLVSTTTGKNGTCRLARKPEKISLLDIYRAVDAPKAFAIHAYPEQSPCIVSCNIKQTLEGVLRLTQTTMETSLAKIKLSDVIFDLKKTASPAARKSSSKTKKN